MEFKTVSHANHADMVGLTRVVTTVQTVGFYSKIKDQPEHPFSTCNHGKGFYTDFGKAGNYIFDGTTVRVKDARKQDRGVIYELEFYDREQNMEETMMDRKMVNFIKEQYPPGTRIRLNSMDDPYAPILPGTEGEVDFVDDAGQLHMKWDNGRSLALIPGEDSFTVLPPKLTTLKLYMPLTADLYERNEYGDFDDSSTLLEGRELRGYQDQITAALVKNRMPEETERGLMHWYDEADSVDRKVRSAVFTVEKRDRQLWGVAECRVAGELSDTELETLKEYLTGQASDGWGEGFEQREISMDDGGELYVHFWNSDEWSIQTEQELFTPKLAEGLPELCFSTLPGTGELICIKRGESGYYPSDWSTDDPAQNRELADYNNERLGVTQAQRLAIQYKKLYGYRKGEDGQPEIIPEQAEIVRWLYERYLTGASLRMIKDELEQQGVKCFEDSPEWTISRIRSILQNEKYCGDVLMQKTFRQDFINRKAIKNTGQLPMYLIENHHEGIVSREKYDAVQAEMARRNAAKSPSKNAVTGMASYASKYALSERLVCGECGTLYRRCTWTRNGEKRVVWRCVSRLDYGKKYCHNSPTLDEAPLQQAILAALNTAMADKNSLIRQITAAMETELIPFPGGTMSLGDIECRLRVLEQQFQTLLEKATDDPAAYGGQFKEILDEQTFLKEKRSVILANNNEQAKANQRIMDAAQTLENASPYITEWDESAVRQLVETVKILSKDEVAVTLKGGIEICQKIMY